MKRSKPAPKGGPDAALTEIVELVEAARRRAARSVNAVMTAAYWSIGRRIVLEEQQGARRAEYGDELIEHLARRLTKQFGRGFGTTNLKQMRTFYLAYSTIRQMASDELGAGAAGQIRQTGSDEGSWPSTSSRFVSRSPVELSRRNELAANAPNARSLPSASFAASCHPQASHSPRR
ncbi:MAG: hypothetical protein IPQ07_08330 [Myxococcales bacterium]|nr:hypothetical protein [Myxococcales bacterium]